MNWREYLISWKQKNSLKRPEGIEKTRQDFIEQFPRQKLAQLTLEEYALNHPDFSKNSFCYWLKFKIKNIDDTKNRNSAYGIYWDTSANQWKWHRKIKAQTQKDAFYIVKTGILSLINAVEEDRLEELDAIAFEHFGTGFNRIPLKILYIYFPNLFFPQETYALDLFLDKQLMKSFSSFCDPQEIFENFNLKIYFEDLRHALFYSMTMNHKLCLSFKDLPEFREMDTYNIGIFLDDCKRHLDTDKEDMVNNTCSRDNFITNTNSNVFLLNLLCRSINRKKNIVLHGAPGTGKTFIATKFAQYLVTKSDGFVEILQFHPAYTYEDFIQGLRPKVDESGNLVYKIVAGRFLEFCKKARQRTGKCILIIDEINRSNLSAVFGELMYLLEYRNQAIRLSGSNELFSIPENVYIIGTMNTADRSIALVDHALRRRFAFIELFPDYNVLRKWHEQNETEFNVEPLINVIEKVNIAIGDHHYHLGISFFLDQNLNENLPDIWELEIYPYLEKYFYDNPEQCAEFQWKKVQAEIMG
ncbi:hypothetical protein AWQ21_11210 [Picosynechococcus sp. PCC 7003]|uniref:McrB family protein n=1 Tax=Picosynechococcus sp. PCC 7003 TaxID=374981 RepID=UPI00081079C3|nr:AAA family ATPase [Picosynechococcus sp. PCC 7003]ANV84895.1 hypothetical protein AWQ21_11210 [Picosynechococcus sp. PCC 7003]